MLGKKICVAIFLIFSSSAFAQTADAILGKWLTEKKTAVIEIYKAKDTYEGKIVWLKRIADGEVKDILDVENPDEKLQKRSVLNLKNLSGFKFEGDEWTGGKIYDPKSGKTYSAKMSLKEGKLHLRGYVGVPLFGRTSVWTRHLK